MMSWEKQTIEDSFTKELREHIFIHLDDGGVTSFPAEESNPRYVEFLKQLEDEQNVT